jgi:putative flippase GtrA
MKSIDATVPRFLVAGLVNTGVTYALYLLLLRLVAYRTAFSIAFVAGIALSYALNARFVFRRPATWASLVRFPLVYLAQYFGGLALVSMSVEWLAVPTWLAPIVALVVTIPLTYSLSRMIFISRRDA